MINRVIAIGGRSRFNRKETRYYTICDVVKSEFQDLEEFNKNFGTWYNCLDSNGNKVVIFDAFDKGTFIVHSRGKWLGA